MVERVRRTRVIPIKPVADAPDVLDEDESPDDRQAGETEQQAADRIAAKYRERATSPLKAIRAFCVSCMGHYPRQVAKCTATQCLLHPFRFGKNPFQKHSKKESAE